MKNRYGYGILLKGIHLQVGINFMAVSQKNINLFGARNNGLKKLSIFSISKKIELKSSNTYKKVNNSSSFSWDSVLAIAPFKAQLVLLPCLAMGTLLCNSAQAQSIIPDA